MIRFDSKGRLQIDTDALDNDAATKAVISVVTYAYNTIMLRKISSLMVWGGLAGLWIAGGREKKIREEVRDDS